jgi:hypothetical protein
MAEAEDATGIVPRDSNQPGPRFEDYKRRAVVFLACLDAANAKG